MPETKRSREAQVRVDLHDRKQELRSYGVDDYDEYWRTRWDRDTGHYAERHTD